MALDLLISHFSKMSNYSFMAWWDNNQRYPTQCSNVKQSVQNLFSFWWKNRNSTEERGELKDSLGSFCFHNEARPFFSACCLLWICSRLREWKVTQAHMVRFVSTHWGSRADMRGEVRSGAFLLISKLKGMNAPLALSSSYFFGYSSALNVGSFLKLHRSTGHNTQGKFLLKDIPFLRVWIKLRDLLQDY